MNLIDCKLVSNLREVSIFCGLDLSMADMTDNFNSKRNEEHYLDARDVADALRLINKLMGSKGQVRLVGGPVASPLPEGEHDDEQLARRLLARRRQRAHHFAPSMFGEPAWDMLLALYTTDRGEGRNTISRLADVSNVPMTTALRWLDYLEHAKLVIRVPSPTDLRVIFIQLTERGRSKIAAYFREVRDSARAAGFIDINDGRDT